MRIPDDLHQLAASQDGLVTRQQALAAGMSAESIRHMLGAGQRWQRIVAGVYATFTGVLGSRHRIRAALLHAGPRALVTGAYACRAVGMRYVPRGAPLVVLVASTNSRTQTVLAQLRRIEIMPPPMTIDGIPVAPLERCVLDTCHGLTSLRSIRALLCESVQLGLTTPERVLETLGGACWKGAGLVRRALDDAVAGCRSAPECELRDLVRTSAVLSEPLWNAQLPGGSDASIVPDACWPGERVVVEIDSAEWHRRGDLVERTERRRARLAALGWTVIAVSPRRLREEPGVVLREIEAAVIAGRQRRSSAA